MQYETTKVINITWENTQVNTFHDTQIAATHRPRCFGIFSYDAGGMDWPLEDIIQVFSLHIRTQICTLFD